MDASLYIEHFSDADIAFLAGTAGVASVDDLRRLLHANPEILEALLPDLYGSLFGADALLRVSPFLIFAAVVHRAARDLESVHFVQEWIGPGTRVPMFEVDNLRSFVNAPVRRFFLAEVLASYTRVASGTVWTQTPRGWRRRRYSDLDPLRLVELIDSAPEREQGILYRRLGDLTLFLTGVFPDYAGRRFLPPIAGQRLRRAVPDVQLPETRGLGSGSEPVWLLEELGRRSYRMAWQATEGWGGRKVDLLADVADSFGDARRMLNFLTDQYLFRHREQWFPLAES